MEKVADSGHPAPKESLRRTLPTSMSTHFAAHGSVDVQRLQKQHSVPETLADKEDATGPGAGGGPGTGTPASEEEHDGCRLYERARIRALTEERARVQKKTFTKWVNMQLERAALLPLDDLYVDLRDGRVLLKLLEILTGERMVSARPSPLPSLPLPTSPLFPPSAHLSPLPSPLASRPMLLVGTYFRNGPVPTVSRLV